ncbi:hypothetical protein PG_0068 [Porphyromonas gingivalis W83]|uniref:Uncharacterized protein n=1 Tax=Porphyromonas gingivalis (strain ATCC BAA-308 / W83) TaxID=242619 RepID=Q7MXU0_PORGI|nr:hypothetical protein PG_0068 [Porphyromonas gingivalis W83]
MAHTRSLQMLKAHSTRSALRQPQKKETGTNGNDPSVAPKNAQADSGKDERRGSQAMGWSCFGGCIKDEIFSVFGIGRKIIGRV